MGWALNPLMGVLLRKGKREDTQSHDREGYVKREMEPAMTYVQVKECGASAAATVV